MSRKFTRLEGNGGRGFSTFDSLKRMLDDADREVAKCRKNLKQLPQWQARGQGIIINQTVALWNKRFEELAKEPELHEVVEKNKAMNHALSALEIVETLHKGAPIGEISQVISDELYSGYRHLEVVLAVLGHSARGIAFFKSFFKRDDELEKDVLETRDAIIAAVNERNAKCGVETTEIDNNPENNAPSKVLALDANPPILTVAYSDLSDRIVDALAMQLGLRMNPLQLTPEIEQRMKDRAKALADVMPKGSSTVGQPKRR